MTFILIAGQTVSAATLTNAQVKAVISDTVTKQYQKYTDARIRLEVINLPFDKIEVPEGKVTYSVVSNFDKFVKRDIKRVSIYVNGSLVNKFVVSIDAKAFKNVLVASRYIDRDSAITRSSVTIKEMEVSANLENILTEEALEKELIARKWFREGEIIDKRFVKMKPDVARNSEVQALFNSNNILIALSVNALGEGMVGDYIELESKSLKRRYRGQIIGTNKVLIKI